MSELTDTEKKIYDVLDKELGFVILSPKLLVVAKLIDQAIASLIDTEREKAGRSNEQGGDDLKGAALEAFPELMMYGGGQPPYDQNEELRKAFIKGFEFRHWIQGVLTSSSNIPLHIKYRMFKNQVNFKTKTH